MAKEFSQKKLSNLELAEFCGQMHLILHAGISALEGLNILLEDAQNDAEKELLRKMIQEMEITGYFFEAASDSFVFPDYALYMIKLGEETGTLDEVMNGLSRHYIREENMAGMIRSSFIYPSIMLGMMTLVVLVLLTKVMPIFNQVFRQLGQEMTGFSAGLLNLGGLLSKYSIAMILVLILLIALCFWGRKKIPFYKNIHNQLAACRFADGMAIALKSGMTVEQSLNLVENLLENDEFRKKVVDCREKIASGNDLAAALHSSGIFNGTYARMATIAEKAGAMDEAMSNISEEYEHSVNTKINQMISMIEPTLVIVLSVIVGIILFSVMLPLLGIMSGL